MSTSILDQRFESKNFSGQKLSAQEYDNCLFESCDFTDSNLSAITFLECRFENCNLGNVMLKEASFQDVQFSGCKLLGVDFGNCNDFMFSVNFDDCILDYASFYGFHMKHTIFKTCSLKEADFTQANLQDSVFQHCNLSKSVFENTNLEKVDFSTSEHYTIDPEKNRLKKAKFNEKGLIGLLTKHDLIIK